MSTDNRSDDWPERSSGRSNAAPSVGDGSQRPEVKEAPRESEKRYRFLFNSIDEGFCIIEMLFDEEERPMDFRYLEANPAFEEQSGLEDPAGKWARELIPDLEECWFEAYGEVALTGQPLRFEDEVCALGRYFDVYAFRVGRPEERQVAVLFKDITVRREAEEAFRESEAKLEEELEAVKQLQRVSTQLIREESLSALDEQILDAAIDLMDSDAGTMQKYCPEREELQLLAWQGFDAEAAASRELITVESGSVCGEALRREGRVIVEDVEACDFVAGTEDLDFYRRSGIRAAQTTPLVSRSGQVVGMLTTHWREPHEPDGQMLQLLDILARQAADLIDRLRAEEALRGLNEELEERVRERTQQVRSLANALSEAEEKERERIADVLHDDVQQLLFGAELALRALRWRTGELPYQELREELQGRLDQLREILDEAQESVRTLSAGLSPPLLRGERLEVIFKWLARHFEECYGLSVELDLEEGFRFAGEAQRRFLFQLARELLFNVVKHAGVEEARVEGRRTEKALLLEVSDGGKGFRVEKLLERQSKGRGLRAMKARLELLGGDMYIDTAPGKGTRVTVSMPTRTEEGG